MKYMDLEDMLDLIANAAKKRETVLIYYPKTENTPEGWREVEPYSFATGVGAEGEHVVYGQEIIGPGHIFNAYTVGSGDSHCDSFVIGKIKGVKSSKNNFKPRWQVEI